MSVFDLFHEKEVRAAKAAAQITTAIENALKSNEAIEVAMLVPEGQTLRTETIALCEIALKGIAALQTALDGAGVSGRLQRLGTDLTALHEEHARDFGHYVKLFETAYRDLIGKGDDK